MDKLCPLMGDPCLEHRCEWFGNVQGTNPQTGQMLDQWSCAISFLPMLLIENTKLQGETGAAIESFRNEMVRGNEEMLENSRSVAGRILGNN